MEVVEQADDDAELVAVEVSMFLEDMPLETIPHFSVNNLLKNNKITEEACPFLVSTKRLKEEPNGLNNKRKSTVKSLGSTTNVH